VAFAIALMGSKKFGCMGEWLPIDLERADMGKSGADKLGFLKDRKGATLAEYALLATLIVIAALAAMALLGTAISNEFTSVGECDIGQRCPAKSPPPRR
jgi:Flp pilus assembly pilin Flp